MSPGTPQPITAFYKYGLGVFGECKKCNNARNYAYKQKNFERVRATYRAWYIANTEKRRAYNKSSSRKNVEFKSRYGITLAERDSLAESQQGRCAVCLLQSKLYVDHDHLIGNVRGLLCDNCNKAIGLIKDSAETARRIAGYLETEQWNNS